MTASETLTVLVVGATGSIGRRVVTQALDAGHTVRALVREERRAGRLDPRAEVVVGRLTAAETLAEAVEGIDAVVFTHGAAYGSDDARDVDYGAVRNVLAALDGRPVRIALMTAIGVTGRGTTHDWKRRSERLVRASGNRYTIVRPGWFDANEPDQVAITFLQGDTRHAGSPADGVIARDQIARVLVDSLTSPAADRRTVELVAEHGPAPEDLDPLFAATDPDPVGQVDGVRDQANLPASAEPAEVAADLQRLGAAS
jgi:uncharacterized protein YbjT (DUF2867 family)